MLALHDIHIHYGAFALAGLSLHVPDATYATLMGPTGCGKTTLLEVICGLRRPLSGRVVIDNEDLTFHPPGSRGIGYVPQDGALFPTMTIRQHLAFAPKLRRWRADEIEHRVATLADHLEIAHLLDRLPPGLSGGERQRVALGRALAMRPAALLLDEPLSALDPDLRAGLADLLKQIQQEERITVLHVTHDRAEAARLGDLHLTLSRTGTLRSAE